MRRGGSPVTVSLVLGLPTGIDACLFDLDGVLTDTATVHAAAWKSTFDGYLRRREAERGTTFVPFGEVEDYDRYVDGRPRDDGVRTFLASRGITLPEGSPADPPSAETVHGLGNAKNALVQQLIEDGGVTAYPGSVRYVEAGRHAGLRRAVVSSSANCRAVLRAARIDALFEAVVDGQLAAARHLRGKPAPDTYLTGAELLGVEAERAAVFEDALAGVEAGRAGRFGFVVGVDRTGQADDLLTAGADTVVTDLADLLGQP